MPMKLKMDGDKVVVQDGKPVYVKDDGTETAFDVEQTIGTITRLNGEAKTHREAKEAAEAAIKAFEGLDPVKARKALETTKNLDDKKLVDAGEVDRIKAEVIAASDAKYKPDLEERDDLRSKLSHRAIRGEFDKSDFITKKMTVPPDFVFAQFRDRFHYDPKTDKVVPKDPQGNNLLSLDRPGEVATVDEAMSIFVNALPYKNDILKGTGATGGGSNPGSTNGGGSGNTGQKTLSRKDYDAMDPAARMDAVMTQKMVVVD